MAPKLDLVVQGFTAGSDQARLALSTVCLLRGQKTTIVDAAHYGRRVLIEERLRALGVAPEQVDTLVLTHLHWDHMQCIDLFPNATIYVHPAELEYVKSPRTGDWATMRYVSAALAGREVKTVEEGDEIEPGLRVIETPGHTVGSISLVLDAPEGTTGIVGDALPNARTALKRKPYLIFFEERAAEQSGEKIVSTCQVLYCGHDRPFRLVPGEQRVEYLMPSTIKFHVFFEPGSADHGVTLSSEPPAPVWILNPDGKTNRQIPWSEV
jgi:glyoxylase-like metal-dependent hydrolase (beta-lactamase superfamily II)